MSQVPGVYEGDSLPLIIGPNKGLLMALFDLEPIQYRCIQNCLFSNAPQRPGADLKGGTIVCPPGFSTNVDAAQHVVFI
jgi:hypothetical protein